jgi:hypothetical protein
MAEAQDSELPVMFTVLPGQTFAGVKLVMVGVQGCNKLPTSALPDEDEPNAVLPLLLVS